MSSARQIRAIGVGWWMHLKMLHRSVFDSVMQVLWPLFFATVALLVYRVHADAEALVYAALGAAVMTIWTAISSSASAVLQHERGMGTLELLVAAPTPFTGSVLAIVLAVSTVGVYGMLATLLWARLLFGVAPHVADPASFGLALAGTVASFAVLGFILSVTVVRYRAAWALGSAFEFPVWLACGFLVPSALLPGWLRPVSLVLPPYWGMAAIRDGLAGRAFWPDLLCCLALSAGYGLLGVGLTAALLRSARRHATLSLS